MYNYRGWSKTKERKVVKPVSGVYAITTSTHRKIMGFAESSTEAANNTLNSLTRNEQIISVGRYDGK